ncbi:hypothetical protein Lalb_Chr13g0297341 [Lupinus albus]|uniref:Uncharacterized protein n=1 Tax=Lupinus albus TaxID=3870 RepID=A0A6A4PIL6_LUPAL|nr:hypothetical protein Lalb_Chr13g0297341 [Lupinus albus]
MYIISSTLTITFLLNNSSFVRNFQQSNILYISCLSSPNETSHHHYSNVFLILNL